MNINNKDYTYISTLVNKSFENMIIDINNHKNYILENIKSYYLDNNNLNKKILEKKLINNNYYYIDYANNLIYNKKANLVGKINNDNYVFDINNF